MVSWKRTSSRCVTLKVIKPDMDVKQVVARFEVDRQALVLMDHPNIARLNEATGRGDEAASLRERFGPGPAETLLDLPDDLFAASPDGVGGDDEPTEAP